MSGHHVCMYCGLHIDPRANDPCSAILSVAVTPDIAQLGRSTRRGSSWWKQPPGQYWFHADCLRGVVHPTIALQFLDIAANP